MIRYGAKADAVFMGGAIDSILSLTDSVPKDDVRVCFFLRGFEDRDDGGAFVRVTAPSSDTDDAVGMCITSAEEGTEPSESDLELFRKNFDEGLLMVVDPYACEFNVYRVKGQRYELADILMSE